MAFINWSFFSGVLTGTTVMWWIYEKLHKKNKKADECLLFVPSYLYANCIQFRLRAVPPCNGAYCPFCNYRKFLALLKSARKSLDICVFLITSKEVKNAVVDLFHKGIFVRIILDVTMCEEAKQSQMYTFMKNYIPVKVSKNNMMHNKFVVIDNKMVITGSFNWTLQGITSNFENAMIVYNEEIVAKFSQYFEDMWRLF